MTRGLLALSTVQSISLLFSSGLQKVVFLN